MSSRYAHPPTYASKDPFLLQRAHETPLGPSGTWPEKLGAATSLRSSARNRRVLPTRACNVITDLDQSTAGMVFAPAGSMEHRCGYRRAVNVSVTVRTRAGLAGKATLC